MKKTVVICDTQPIAIEGLRALVTQHHDLAVAGEATSLMAGMELVRNLSPSMLIVDKGFGLQPVMDWVANLRGNGRRTAVVVWGNALNEAEALRMVQAGTQGVIRKTAALAALLDCLRMVAAGNTWMDELMFQSPDKTNGSGRSSLTSREQQVAELVEQGLKNKEIARTLGICAGTVKIHLKHIFVIIHLTQEARADHNSLCDRPDVSGVVKFVVEGVGVEPNSDEGMFRVYKTHRAPASHLPNWKW